MIHMGSFLFIVSGYFGAMCLIGVGAVLMKSSIRVGGPLAWVLFLFLGPIGGLLAMPILSLTPLYDYAVPLAAVAMTASFMVVHFLMPTLARDFQTDSFSASVFLAFLIGLSFGSAALGTGQVHRLIPTDPSELHEYEGVDYDQIREDWES